MDPDDCGAHPKSKRRPRPVDAGVIMLICVLGLLWPASQTHRVPAPLLPTHNPLGPDCAASKANRYIAKTSAQRAVLTIEEMAWRKALERVMVQLHFEPGLIRDDWPDHFTPWGHVPEFTLFDDGTIVYLDARNDLPIVLSTKIEEARAEALVKHVVELGFDRLKKLDVGVEDAGDITLCVRRHGALVALHGVNVRASVSDPKAFESIVGYLADWSMPAATPLEDDRAVLFAYSESDRSARFASNVWTAFDDDVLSQYSALDTRLRTWPSAVALPQRVPTFVERNALVTLRSLIPKPVGLHHSYWAWEFHVPSGNGKHGSQRIVAVPWIYADRYAAVEEDIAAYYAANDALAAEAASWYATATALAVQPTEEAARRLSP